MEGGFDPDDITPRPPFTVVRNGQRRLLHFSPERGGTGELTVLGGLKTKLVDVAVTRRGIGPCIAISMKGTLSAFRNLTNRMEEAVGDCANLHIAYPALVYGFLHIIKANVDGPDVPQNNVALRSDGMPTEPISRYHDVMSRLTGRSDVRDESSKYEAVSLVLANVDTQQRGEILKTYPSADSPLLYDRFFEILYRNYDMRFVYAAPALKSVTRRVEWDPASPAFAELAAEIRGFSLRTTE